jgi:Flp pilus assembly pilin Flp
MVASLKAAVREFLRREDGQSAIEYAAVMSWIALTVMTTVRTLSNRATTTFNTVGSQLGRTSGS